MPTRYNGSSALDPLKKIVVFIFQVDVLALRSTSPMWAKIDQNVLDSFV